MALDESFLVPNVLAPCDCHVAPFNAFWLVLQWLSCGSQYHGSDYCTGPRFEFQQFRNANLGKLPETMLVLWPTGNGSSPRCKCQLVIIPVAQLTWQEVWS